MKTIIAAFLTLFFVSNGHALVLRGGEHGQFSRLVLDAPSGENWEFLRTRNGYYFRFRSSENIDLTQAFDRLYSGRILSISASFQGFEIILGCECAASAYSSTDGFVVIDIGENLVRRSGSDASPIMPDLDIVMRDNGESSVSAQLLELSVRSVVEPLRARILRNLSAAASEREPDDPQPTERLLPSQVSGAIQDCPSSDEVDVTGWLRADLAGNVLAGWRGAAEASSDASPSVDVARGYLALGFGHEAESMIAEVPAETRSRDLLKGIARLTDHVLPGDFTLAAYSGCSGPILVWRAFERALSQDAGPHLGLDGFAIAAEFDALPAHIRRNLGPSLMRWFLIRTERDAADLVLSSIRRAAADSDGDMPFVEIEYRIFSGQHDAAYDLAMQLVNRLGDSRRRWQALMFLVEAAAPLGRPVPVGTAAGLDASLSQAELAGEGERAARAFLLALALEGQFARAFSGLNAAPDAMPQLWRLAAQAAPDDVFLRHAVASPTVLAVERKSVGREVSIVIARRLLSLGFPEASLGWLGSKEHDTPSDIIDVMAEAHLQLRDPAGVLTVLDGRNDASAADMRARALMQLGEMSQASEALKGADAAERQGQAFRWARNWAGAADGAPETWRPALTLTLERPEPVSEDAPLAQAKALLDNSSRVKSAMSTLLPGAVHIADNGP